MDARVPDNVIAVADYVSDDFLLSEGLELLAIYRSIRNEAVRLAVKEMIAVIAKATDNVH